MEPEDNFTCYYNIPLVDKELKDLKNESKVARTLSYIAAIESIISFSFYQSSEKNYVLLSCSAAAAYIGIYSYLRSSKLLKEVSELEKKLHQKDI